MDDCYLPHQSEMLIYEATIKILKALKADSRKLLLYKSLWEQYTQTQKKQLYQECRKITEKVRLHGTD